MWPTGPPPQDVPAVDSAAAVLVTADAGLDLTQRPDLVDTLDVDLPAGDSAVAAARAAVRQGLADHAASDVLDTAALLVSEVVTNSVRHADLREDDVVRLSLRVEEGLARVEVENPGTAGAVVARPPTPEAGGGGYGLFLLDALAHRWGVVREDARTRVWLELILRPA